MAVKPVPDGFHTVTPYLVVRGVPALLDFLTRAFNAEIMERTPGEDGAVTHAQVRIGDSMVMTGEAPEGRALHPATLYLYVPDCDAVYRQAIAAGGVSEMEPSDMFYGDRNGAVRDPAGNSWWIASHVEDVSPEELARRARERGR